MVLGFGTVGAWGWGQVSRACLFWVSALSVVGSTMISTTSSNHLRWAQRLERCCSSPSSFPTPFLLFFSSFLLFCLLHLFPPESRLRGFVCIF